jgi:hypothetical protein
MGAELITISTCVGCGALSLPGTCPEGCFDERKLELISAFEYDQVRQQSDRAARHVAELRNALVRYTDGDTCEAGAALPAARADARTLLQAVGRSGVPDAEQGARAEAIVAWRCARCGGIDAPQPCIGVCTRTPTEWVRLAFYEEERNRLSELLRQRQRLLDVVREFAFVTPKDGREALNWQRLRTRARQALIDAPGQPATRHRGTTCTLNSSRQ